MSRCEDEQMWRWADVKMSRCEDEKVWRWADVKMSRCEDEKVWRWADVKMSRCEDEQVWRWADVKMSRCEDEQMWRWARWADVKMSRCEDEQMWRWADVKMSRWAGVKMSRCEDEKMWRWADVKMSRCEDEQVWRWADVKMRKWDTDPHYWKNPALRRSREKTSPWMWLCGLNWPIPFSMGGIHLLSMVEDCTFAVRIWRCVMSLGCLFMLPNGKVAKKTHVPKCFLWHLSHFWRSGGHLDAIQSSNPVKILHPSEASPLGHPQKDHFTEIPFAGGFGKSFSFPVERAKLLCFSMFFVVVGPVGPYPLVFKRGCWALVPSNKALFIKHDQHDEILFFVGDIICQWLPFCLGQNLKLKTHENPQHVSMRNPVLYIFLRAIQLDEPILDPLDRHGPGPPMAPFVGPGLEVLIYEVTEEVPNGGWSGVYINVDNIPMFDNKTSYINMCKPDLW